MNSYIGVKLVNAEPMSRGEYNVFRGWTLPADEDPADEGYLVEYRDGGRANTDKYVGYVSWSPADVFRRSYRHTTGMNFGLALEVLKMGEFVQRSGWNGKGLKLGLVGPGGAFECSFGEVSTLPYIVIVYPRDAANTPGAIVPWLASQTDMLAEDWSIVD